MRNDSPDASPILLAIILVLVVGGVLLTFLNLRPDPIKEALSGDRVINTLFVIEREGKPLGSYVIFYYPDTNRAAIFDIPREVGLILERIDRVDRIDRIYDPQRVGPYQEEIGKLLGIEVHFSMIMDLENLGKAVDLIEGVEIFIPAAVEIYGETPCLFPSGLTRLDGDKARLYITYEIPEEDSELAQFRRQRFFLGFLKRLGEKAAYLAEPPVAKMYQGLLRSAMSPQIRARLFSELARVDVDRVSIQSVGGTLREVSGQTLLFPAYNGSLIKEIVRQALTGLTRQAGDQDRIFTVEILNGTGENGLAGRTADLLRGFGYDVISIGNADRSDYEATVVIDRSGYEDMARMFADIIRCENIRLDAPANLEPGADLNIQNLEYKSDFTLILGRDFNGRYVTGG